MNRILGMPLLRVEMRTRMRDWRSYGLLSVYLGSLALVEGAFLLQDSGSVSGNPLSLGVQLFDRLALAQAVLVFILTPMVMAGAASGERERGTWDLLMTTPLSPFAIVTGKLAARLLFLVLLIVAGLPLVSVAFLYGDVSPADVVPTYLVLLGTSVLLGAIAFVISSVNRRLFPAIVGSYLVALLLGVGLTVLVARVSNGAWRPFDLPATSTSISLPGVAQINVVAALDSALPSSPVRSSTDRAFGLPIHMDTWLAYLIISGLASLVLLLEAVMRIRASGGTGRGTRAIQP